MPLAQAKPPTSADRPQPPPLPRRPPARPLNRVVGAASEGMARLTLSHSKEDDRYAFTKGAAVIIANTEGSSDGWKPLPGYRVDVERLSAVLPKVGFELYRDPQFNLTAEEMQSFMRNVGLALDNDGDAYDAVMVALLSHGNQDVIFGTDGKAVPLEDLYACVNRPICLGLVKKPKLFIVQACRGHQREDADSRPASTSIVPMQADYLHAFASPRGYVSWVSDRKGSFYIRTLVKCLESSAKSCDHFADILTTVNREMMVFAQRGYPQVPAFNSQLSKKLFLYSEAEAKAKAVASYSEGLARKKEKKWPEAVAAFRRCVALDANHSDAWFQLGYAYDHQTGSYKSTEASYEPYTRCVALDPKNAAAHHNLGDVLLNVRKDYDGAELHYRKVIELKPSYALAHYALTHNNLGTLLKDVRKDYDAAEKHYRKAIELDPKCTSPLWNLSLILEYQKNDIPGAIELVEEYVKLGGNNSKGIDRLAELRAKLRAAEAKAKAKAAASYREGLAWENEKKWPEAIAALRRCVDLDANHSDAWFWLGQSYYLQNGSKNCEAEYEPWMRCIALDPKHAAAHHNLGIVLKNVRKDYDGAERHYRKAIELEPTASRYNSLGTLLDARKDYDAAERMFRKAIELDPSCAEAQTNLGYLLRCARKDYDGAERHYRKAIELEPTALSYNSLGSILKTVRKDYDGAEKMFRKAIELDPKLTAARWNLSLILEDQKNDIPGAIELVEEYVKLGGNNSKGIDRLAELRAKLK
jgi:tetratricopeptide (TPR) repeat protein